MIKRFSHVAIATKSIAITAEFYKKLGLEMDCVEVIEDQKVKVAVLRTGDSGIELVEPLSDDSPVSRFLEQRGDGLHHISLEVENLAETLTLLKDRNVRLIDEQPRPGADDGLVAFIHPSSTGGVLIELCQSCASGESQ